MTSPILIRRATPADGAAAASVAESVRYRPSSADPAQGYLVHVRTPDEYAALFAQPSSAAWVALGPSGEPLAFLWAALRDPDSRFWYIEQIGVHPAVRRLGLAPSLLATLHRELKPSRLECQIMHAPLRNQRSLAFFTRHGWTLLAEDPDPPFLWGRYLWLPPHD